MGTVRALLEGICGQCKGFAKGMRGLCEVCDISMRGLCWFCEGFVNPLRRFWGLCSVSVRAL